jgi:hypothetical protein
MRYIVDSVNKYILILRKPRNGCLEGRTSLIQPLANSFTTPSAGIPPVLFLFYQAGVRRADRRQLALAAPVTILP